MERPLEGGEAGSGSRPTGASGRAVAIYPDASGGRHGALREPVADRWRKTERLGASGIPACESEVRGMGQKDGAEDPPAFRLASDRRKATPLPSPLLRPALAEERTDTDAAGNSKLAKNAEGGRRLRARDDAVVAAILGVAAGTRNRGRPGRPIWRCAGVFQCVQERRSHRAESGREPEGYRSRLPRCPAGRPIPWVPCRS